MGDRMSKYDQVFIFLSYSRKDEAEIIVIENTLLKMNISRKQIFRDIPSIVLGDDWLDKVIKAIEEANVCFFLWTNNIEDSNIIKSERESAESLMKRIEFKNKGLFEGENPVPYYIVDIVADKLTETLKLRLDNYGTKHQIRFESTTDFTNNVVQTFKKEVTPLLDRIQEQENLLVKVKQVKLDKTDQLLTESIEELRTKVSKFVKIGLALESQYQYKKALFLYEEARRYLGLSHHIALEDEETSLDTRIADLHYVLGSYSESLAISKKY